MAFAQSTFARARPFWQKVFATHGSDKLHELTKVRTISPVSDHLNKVAAGTIGTIVHVHEKGKAYEVEFDSPAGAVLFTKRDQIEPA